MAQPRPLCGTGVRDAAAHSDEWFGYEVKTVPLCAAQQAAQQKLRPQDRRRPLPDNSRELQAGRSYIDPSLARLTVGEWAARWVKDGRLARNPADSINLPRVSPAERLYLTHAQVEQLSDTVSQPYRAGSRAPWVDREAARSYRLVVLFLAYTGVRWGEMAALRVRRIDFLRRRATIAESVTLVKGVATWGTPKGHARREVPIPRFLIDELAEHVKGKKPNDLVFTGVKGGPLRSQAFQGAALTAAAERIGVPGLTPHMLRRTAASLAIASGANVKVLQQMLGHKSATVTLDLYGHLFEDRLDVAADARDVARSASARAGVAPVLPKGQIVDLA